MNTGPDLYIWALTLFKCKSIGCFCIFTIYQAKKKFALASETKKT